MMKRRRPGDTAWFESATRLASARFANDGTRAIFARILDDLSQRIEDRRIDAADAAAIVGRLRAFCADEPPTADRHGDQRLRSLSGLKSALAPERFAARARALADSYTRLSPL